MAGPQRGKKRLTDDQKKEVLRLYSEDLDVTVKEIADRYGISFVSIHNWRKEAGIPRRGNASGPRNGFWKGGNRQHREHRRVMEEIIGRRLESHETVHHINGNDKDNRPENLQLRQGRHGKGAVAYCGHCGSRDIRFEEIKDG